VGAVIMHHSVNRTSPLVWGVSTIHKYADDIIPFTNSLESKKQQQWMQDCWLVGCWLFFAVTQKVIFLCWSSKTFRPQL
jgi:hypothetical protein